MKCFLEIDGNIIISIFFNSTPSFFNSRDILLAISLATPRHPAWKINLVPDSLSIPATTIQSPGKTTRDLLASVVIMPSHRGFGILSTI